jgi:hypothetical protein
MQGRINKKQHGWSFWQVNTKRSFGTDYQLRDHMASLYIREAEIA